MFKDIQLRVLVVLDGEVPKSSDLQFRKKLSSQGPNGRYIEEWTDWETVPVETFQTGLVDENESEDDDEDD